MTKHLEKLARKKIVVGKNLGNNEIYLKQINQVNYGYLCAMRQAGADMGKALWFYLLDSKYTCEEVRKERYQHCFEKTDRYSKKTEETYKTIKSLLPTTRKNENKSELEKEASA